MDPSILFKLLHCVHAHIAHMNAPFYCDANHIGFSYGCVHRIHLMAHNWQNCERVFLSCHCHEIHRVEEVGLKSANHTLKITIFLW